VTDRIAARLQELKRWRAMTTGGLPDEVFWPDEDDRYQYSDSPHNTHDKAKAPRSSNCRGRDTTEVAVMPDKSNALRVRVMYTTECPEWWRLQIRKRLGRQGRATRAECKAWLEDHGSSMDDVLRQEYDDWQRAAEEGEAIDY
jgi:hypothetical protein